MLVLTRLLDETIVVGDDVFITVVEVRGDRVRLGIEAPADVPVHRMEVWMKIQADRRRDGGGRPPDADRRGS